MALCTTEPCVGEDTASQESHLFDGETHQITKLVMEVKESSKQQKIPSATGKRKSCFFHCIL